MKLRYQKCFYIKIMKYKSLLYKYQLFSDRSKNVSFSSAHKVPFMYDINTRYFVSSHGNLEFVNYAKITDHLTPF